MVFGMTTILAIRRQFMITLNSKQKEAAEFLYGAACVIAVPGAGKTLAMTHRICNLFKNHGIPPESIIGLTITRNAAQAMRDKLYPILQELTSRVTLSTIHSFCNALLREERKTFEILHGAEQIRFIRQVMQKKRIRNLPVGMVIKEISLAKNNIIGVEEFKDLYPNDDTMQKVGDVYAAYEDEKRKKLLLDFNDLLYESYKLLKEKGDVLKNYQERFNHMLVDEFQDCGILHVNIMKLLMNNITKSSF